jgi:hypothetical protein
MVLQESSSPQRPSDARSGPQQQAARRAANCFARAGPFVDSCSSASQRPRPLGHTGHQLYKQTTHHGRLHPARAHHPVHPPPSPSAPPKPTEPVGARGAAREEEGPLGEEDQRRGGIRSIIPPACRGPDRASGVTPPACRAKRAANNFTPCAAPPAPNTPRWPRPGSLRARRSSPRR